MSSTIVIFELWNPQYEYFDAFKVVDDCAHIILVTDTLVTDDSYLTLSGFYTSILHWEIRVFTSS
jgi:hypothetical protein